MNIAILGFDTEGRSSYKYFAAQGHTLTVLDRNAEVVVPDGVDSVLGDGYLDNLDRFDLIIRTAGLPPHTIYGANPTLDQSKVSSQINEFFKVCPTKNIVGVTGTKGKGTTSTLVNNMLAAAGKDVHLAGNIGLPALELLPRLTAESWVVLELSSYQLSDIQYSPKIGVCLLVVPEHLDWHGDFLSYTSAKAQLFAHQTPDDTAIYFVENDASKAIATGGNGQAIPYFAPPGAHVDGTTITVAGFAICDVKELQLLGAHNWQNACAAVTAAWQVTQDTQALRSVLTSFAGLEHRIEFVRGHDEARYYNDSYATGLHATKAAIEAIKEKKIMILGGYDRMLDIDYFGDYIKSNEDEFRKLVLIGASAERLSTILDNAGFTNYFVSPAKSMDEVVNDARQFAEAGDAIVLSPGFASFDMFKNFEERGLQFKKSVEAL